MKTTDYMLIPVMIVLVVVIGLAVAVVPVALIISIIGYGIGLMALGKLAAIVAFVGVVAGIICCVVGIILNTTLLNSIERWND